MQPLYRSESIRALERLALGGATRPLMEAAGRAAADTVLRMLPARARRVLVLAGPGNNGGDAFEVARHLRAAFLRVDVLFSGKADRLGPDARAAFDLWQAAGGGLIERLPERDRWDLVVDGLFGIGLARPIEGPIAALVARVNALAAAGVPVLALDVPSGLDADSGAVLGCAVRASRTISFIALKPALFTLDGPDHCGEIELAALDVDAARLRPPEGRLLDATVLREALAPRPRNFHKGNAGTVAVLGGAPGMVGAALIAARAALLGGAGRVHVGLIEPGALALDPLCPELMFGTPARAIDAATVIAAGPGLGRSEAAHRLLGQAAASGLPLVLDADALNLVAGDPALARRVARRPAPTLVTPHPAEAARLLGCTTPEVQRDRVAAARRIADMLGAWAVLKGNGSVIAAPTAAGEPWAICASGHPGMASAGMGDALTGIVAALLAQGAPPGPALRAAVWAHGAAGDLAATARGGPLGVTASAVIDALPRTLNMNT